MMGTSTQICTRGPATWMPHSVSPALARRDVVAVLRLQRVRARRRRRRPAAGRARGVLGVVGHGQRQVHLPHDEPEEQDRGQHEQQLDARLPAL